MTKDKSKNVLDAVGEVLTFTWTVSRGADTYGYNICTLRNRRGDKLGKCCGGGYDMRGTSFGQWIEERFQAELVELVSPLTVPRPPLVACWDVKSEAWIRPEDRKQQFYGLTVNLDGDKIRVTLDGGCGWNSMETILKAIGLQVRYITETKKTSIFEVVEAL